MLRTMVTQLIQHERIRTTVPKAREVARMADKMVTLAKGGTLHHRRQALSYVRDNVSVRKLFATLGERYADRSGGYTRVLKIGHRYGDAADMALLEFVDRPGELRPANSKWREFSSNGLQDLLTGNNDEQSSMAGVSGHVVTAADVAAEAGKN